MGGVPTMPSLESIYPQVVPFLLVLARVGGLFVFAPVIGSPMIPVRIKALLLFMFSLAIYAGLSAGPPPVSTVPRDIFSLGAAVLTEGLVGVVIGLVAAIPVYAVQLGGLVMDQQIGVGLASVYNPAVDSEGTALGDMLLYIAIAVFILVGGLDSVFLAVARTYERLPMAEWRADALASSPAALISGVTASGFEFALRVAAPVLCIILIETVASSFLMKTMPQVNILSLGFAVRVVAGFAAVLVSLTALERVIGDEVNRVCNLILQWVGSL